MPIGIRGILAAVESHAAASGRFDQVLSFEPKNPKGHEPTNDPGVGLTCAVWMEYLGPLPSAGGLSETAVLLEVNVRIYRSMVSNLDLVDPTMVEAVDDLIAAYSGDFRLGGLIRNVDLVGESNRQLEAQAGYLMEDEVMYRTYTIAVPMILDYRWTQEA